MVKSRIIKFLEKYHIHFFKTEIYQIFLKKLGIIFPKMKWKFKNILIENFKQKDFCFHSNNQAWSSLSRNFC